MSGFSLPISGGTGAATNTVYFGHVPDKFNAINPGFLGNNAGLSNTGNSIQGSFISNWTIYNPTISNGTNELTASFGANTTAPDGTSTAIKVVETATTTTPHAVTAVLNTRVGWSGFQFRFSVFAKAAERTRFALYISNGGFDPNVGFGGSGRTGIRTVFDLAGGQIGVANTAYGAFPYAPISSEIVPFGNGWYRCSMDVFMGQNGGSNAYSFAILLDSGSGTGAESTNYTGNGTSGIYFWKTVALPIAAWSLNSTVFFDDFTTLSHFDLANTTNPGFIWYLNNAFPNFTGLAHTDPTSLSIVNGTQLKIATNLSNQTDLAIMSAAWQGGTNFTASALFQPPMLSEISASWDAFTSPNAQGPTWWTTPVDGRLMIVPGVYIENQTGENELDFFEWGVGGPPFAPSPATSMFWGPNGNPAILGQQRAVYGVAQWYSTFQYQNTDLVGFNGMEYQASQSTLGNQPDISPTFWNVIGPIAASQIIDFTQQQIFSYIWTPNSLGDLGQFLAFFNGQFIFHFGYGSVLPNIPGPPGTQNSVPFNTGDGKHWPLMIGTSTNLNTYVDWVRITQ